MNGMLSRLPARNYRRKTAKKEMSRLPHLYCRCLPARRETGPCDTAKKNMSRRQQKPLRCPYLALVAPFGKSTLAKFKLLTGNDPLMASVNPRKSCRPCLKKRFQSASPNRKRRRPLFQAAWNFVSFVVLRKRFQSPQQNLPKQFFSSRNNTPPMKIKAFFSFIQVLDVKGRGNIHGITFGRNSHPTRGLCNSIFVFSSPRGGLFQFDLIFSLDLCGSNSIFVGPNSIFVGPNSIFVSSSPTRRRTLSIQLDPLWIPNSIFVGPYSVDLCFLVTNKRTL
jgi:hypothetical protein